MSCLKLAAAGAALIFLQPLFADTAAPAGPPLVLTATRTALTYDQTLAPVIVIDRQAIQRSQATDVAELLGRYAGIELARNGGPGQPASIFIRGANSNHTLVMIDGIPINPGTIGGARLQDIQPQDIERIEIVEGPRSALYGSEAIGGVINIITRHPRSGLHAGATAGAGRYASRRASARIDGGSAHTQGSLSVSRFITDGFPPRTDSDISRGNANTTIDAQGNTRVGRFSLSLRHRQAEGSSGYLDFFGTPRDEDFSDRLTAAVLAAAVTDSWSTRITLSRIVDAIDQLQSSDFDHTRRDALDWQNTVTADPHNEVVAGLYLSRETVASEIYGTGYDEITHRDAVYVEDRGDLGPHALTAALRHTRDSDFGTHDTYNLDYGYNLDEATRLTAGIGTGYRAPNGVERFGYGGNPGLQPETSQDIELGLSRDLGTAGRIEAHVFRNRIDQLVVFTVGAGSGAAVGQNQNVAHARIDGVELRYSLAGTDWHWRSGLLVQRPLDLTDGGDLPRRARRRFSTRADIRSGDLDLGGDLLAVGPRRDSLYNGLTDAGYVLTGVDAGWQIQSAWHLRARLDNAFDVAYQTAAGYRSPGRSLWLEIGFSTR